MKFDQKTITIARAALGLISTDWIICQDVHPDQLQRFEHEFGEEMYLTRADLNRLARANFNIEWLVDRILAAPARKAYEQAAAPINRSYYIDVGDPDLAWARRQVAAAEILADLLGLPEEEKEFIP